jgi:hypothetical protein
MTKHNKFIGLLVLGFLVAGSTVGGILYIQASQNKPTASTAIEALLPKLTPDELLERSSGVVLGTVTHLEVEKISSWIRPWGDNEDIVTNATIEVEKYLYNPKQLTSDTVTVQVIGGELGNETMSAEESPSFQIGDRVIVYLNQKEENLYTVYGWALGKYTVDDKNNVAVGPEESFFFRDVFGKEHMTLKEFEDSVALSASKITE